MKTENIWRAAAMLLIMLLTTTTAEAAVGNVVDSGTCGDNLTWTLKENSDAAVTYNDNTYNALTLTISGTGAMTDYAGSTSMPWSSNSIGITCDALTVGSYTVAPKDQTVTLGHNRPGFVIGSYESSDVTITNGTFTMPAKDVTVTATWTPDPDFSSNEEGTEFTIHTAAGWNVFCDLLANGESFSGKTVKLGADIPTAQEIAAGTTAVTRMAGSDKPFCGTFDGDSHTLTFNYGTDTPANEDYAAPFRNVNNEGSVAAAICNLHVAGHIYTSKKYAAGLVAQHRGTVTIRNCRVSTVIHSSTSGDGSHGGIVGTNIDATGSDLTIEGCVFDGKLLTTGQTATNSCGGLVGWKGNSVTITNSLYAPAALADGETEVQPGDSNPSATFCRNGATITNSYYTRTLGTAQGTLAQTITAGGYVTLGLAGTPTEYDVSGITKYTLANNSLNSTLKYGDVYYSGNGKVVSLTLSAAETTPAGFEVTGFMLSPSVGLFINGNVYSFQMPDEDVTVNANVKLKDRTLYKDGYWNTLCLPFNVTLAGSPLADAEARTLTAASITEETTGTTLNLNFGDPVTTLTAGTPYIIKWTRAGNYVNDNTHNIYEPVFTGVTVSDEAHPYDNGASDDMRVRFIGTYTGKTFESEDQSILFLGADNTLYYPQPKDGKNPTIGAFRAYFKIGEDNQQARQLTAFNINFGDGETSSIDNGKLKIENEAGVWYTIDGRKLSGKPTKKGMYIHGGHKVAIK